MPVQSVPSASPYQLDYAELNWQEGDAPAATQYNDIYFSGHQGLEETEYVFLQHNQLQQRWRQLGSGNSSTSTIFTIGETGFGTGLNFLAAWRLWQQQAPDNWQLHYFSVEKHPLRLQDLQRSLNTWPELHSFAKQLITEYPVLLPGHHLLKFDQGRVTLHLLLGDAIDCLEQLHCSDHPELMLADDIKAYPQVDAWFLDGFAPAKNPSLWNDPLYTLIAQLSAAGTTLATFTAVGDVRRGLAKQGFNMEKTTGFGNKREMLKGVLTQHYPHYDTTLKTRKKGLSAPWYVAGHSAKKKQVTIIGGGLAGTSSAYAMAQRGWQVTLVERTPALAQGASGNSQGMLYTKLSPKPGKLNQFTLSSYLYALRFYRQLLEQQHLSPEQLDFCGVLQLATDEKEKKLQQQLQQLFAGQPELVQFFDSTQASEVANIELTHPGWYFPQAGWLSPSDLCRSLATHPRIEIVYNTEVLELEYEQQWKVNSTSGNTLSQNTLCCAEVVIIANSRDAIQFKQTESLPLKTIRGQITGIESTGKLAQLNTVICHEGYLTPAINGAHSLGATFDNNDSNTTLRNQDHQRNLQSLLQAIPSLTKDFIDVDMDSLTGRASLRCTSRDYLPLVGPVHNYQQFLEDYAPLRKNAHLPFSTPGSYYPGLYINVAHGSRGLTSTPLCSELLAATICNETAVLPRELVSALNPARFVIRDLVRNKI
ncbi:MAG: bifunctional tRNA (5-methylaminomethyl-2-thiouridine)(34)-methyltransferase MnmD/FAD-dependent 5-carboxymethylaminomethyl-2-thiouridine(34) oxidoreductase MnmC [Pseudomonadales bacterium]